LAIVDARADAGETRLPIEEEEERVVSSNETPTVVVVVDAAILQNKREKKTSGRLNPSGWCRRRCLLATAENMLSLFLSLCPFIFSSM
jgi:hypothetical protein